MKLRTLTLCMMAAGSMLAASTGMAQPQPTTPAPATQGAAQQERQDQAQQNAAEQRADQASAQQDAKDQLDGDDEDFLENAAQSGAAEKEGSKMAQEKAKNPDVKAFADKMIQDHTKVSEELAALAKSKGYTPPTEPSMLMKAKLKTLSLTDDGFDEMYVDHIGVAAHEDAVKLFEEAAKDAKDPEIKAFAEKTLPALQEHLKMAQTLQQQVKERKEAKN